MEIAGSVVDSTPCMANLSFSLYAVREGLQIAFQTRLNVTVASILAR
jgi:hypothetical protein